jgi:hypothetical protein
MHASSVGHQPTIVRRWRVMLTRRPALAPRELSPYYPKHGQVSTTGALEHESCSLQTTGALVHLRQRSQLPGRPRGPTMTGENSWHASLPQLWPSFWVVEPASIPRPQFVSQDPKRQRLTTYEHHVFPCCGKEPADPRPCHSGIPPARAYRASPDCLSSAARVRLEGRKFGTGKAAEANGRRLSRVDCIDVAAKDSDRRRLSRPVTTKGRRGPKNGLERQPVAPQHKGRGGRCCCPRSRCSGVEAIRLSLPQPLHDPLEIVTHCRARGACSLG